MMVALKTDEIVEGDCAYFPYLVATNAEIDLLKGTKLHEDLRHLRRMHTMMADEVFFKHGKRTFPQIEYNLNRDYVPRAKEGIEPSEFMIMA